MSTKPISTATTLSNAEMDRPPSPSLRPPRHQRPTWVIGCLLWRVILATFGSYFCTVAVISLAARLYSSLFGGSLASSLLTGMLLSFMLYAGFIMAVFASQRLGRTSCWMLGITAGAAFLGQSSLLTIAGGS